jgi:methyl-accepting chemotaxis protein
MKNIAKGAQAEALANEKFAQRLEFLGIDETTREKLRKARPAVEAELPNILGDFYRLLAKWPELQSLFKDENHQQTAKQLQISHWSNILAGNFDEDYRASVDKIGNAHNRIGLEPRWYIGGYAALLGGIFSALIQEYFASSILGGKKREEFEEITHAFLKAALLDMDLAISTYFDAGEEEFNLKVEQMTDSFDKSIASFIREMKLSTDDLGTTATRLSELSDYGRSRAEELQQTAEISSENVSAVASASEQMSASIREINQQINLTNEVTNEAVVKGKGATTAVHELQDASQKVGDIVKLIRDIADQTNLLALNATIESARAGEAGKGFAVVADEVKGLAKETANATEDISRQISEIQKSTQNTVDVIRDITETIEKINEISLAVSSAMEEQSATISEIVQNTHSAAERSAQVNEIAKDVKDSSADTQSVANTVSKASLELAARAEQLRGEVEVFLANLKAA